MNNFDLRKYLAEGKLFEEDFKNPILDKYLELKKSIDYKTVFPTDLQSFLDSLDNTEREGLERDLAEGKLLKEDKGINYLKKAFQIYLEGGDGFNKEVGETETVKFENDGSLIPEEEFKVALQSLPTTVKVDVYNVNFKKVGDNIVGTFKIK